jgi:hypothetical protein
MPGKALVVASALVCTAAIPQAGLRNSVGSAYPAGRTPTAIATSASGDVFVGGSQTGSGAAPDGFIERWASDGVTLIYRTTFPTTGPFHLLAVNASGIVAAAADYTWAQSLIVGLNGDGSIRFENPSYKCVALAVDPASNVVVDSSDPTIPIPNSTIQRYSGTGVPLQTSGVQGWSWVTALAVDSSGAVYVTGSTRDPGFPTTPGAYQTTLSPTLCNRAGPGHPPDFVPCADGFVMKLAPDLSGVVYSTLIGETTQEQTPAVETPTAIAVDASGSAYITGTTTSASFPTTPGAYQESPGPSWVTAVSATHSRPFITKFSPDGSSLVYSTLLTPSTGSGTITTLDLDASGHVYVMGYTNSTGFPLVNPLEPAPPTNDGFWVTEDSGATWRRAAMPDVMMNQDPPFGGIGGGVIYGVGGYASYRSPDLGRTWWPLDNPIASEYGRSLLNTPTTPIHVDPTNANIAYFGLQRTTDGGMLWPLMAGFNGPSDTHAVAVDPSDARVVYAGPATCLPALLKSVDGGTSWTTTAIPVPFSWIGVSPANSKIVYAVSPQNYNLCGTPAAGGELYKSIDGGASWTQQSTGTRPFSQRIPSLDPYSANTVYGVFADVSRSNDGGITWQSLASGLTQPLTVDALALPGGGVRLLVPDSDPGVFQVYPSRTEYSDDGGQTWQIAAPVWLQRIQEDPGNPSTAVAVSAGGATASFISILNTTGTRLVYSSYSSYAAPFALQSGGRVALFSRDDIAILQLPLPRPATVIDIARGTVDSSVLRIAGWAADLASVTGSGVDTVHVWAFPETGAPMFLGAAPYGGARPDVAAAYGPQFANTGFDLTAAAALRPGHYQVGAYAHNAITGEFDARIASVDVPRLTGLVIDTPAEGATTVQPFELAGWALDNASGTGTGIDAVHVWAYPATGSAPIFAGAATLGWTRPDVAAVYGPRFGNAGYGVTVNGLPPGQYTLAVFAHSAATGGFDLVRTVRTTLPDVALLTVDTPTPGSVVHVPFAVSGWAIDPQSAGLGVDAVHVWAFPSGGGDPLFLGAADRGPRPDVAAIYGRDPSEPSGFWLVVTALDPGEYDLYVFGHRASTGTFSVTRIVHVSVR